jgi:hypothetical protein
MKPCHPQAPVPTAKSAVARPMARLLQAKLLRRVGTALSPIPLALVRARRTESKEQLVAQLNRAMVPGLESAAGLQVFSATAERFAPRPRQVNPAKQGWIDLASGIGQIREQRLPR